MCHHSAGGIKEGRKAIINWAVISTLGGIIVMNAFSWEKQKKQNRNESLWPRTQRLTAVEVKVFSEMQRICVLVEEPTVDRLLEAVA